MNRWRKSLMAVALVLFSTLLIVILPLRSLAAPQGSLGTPVFLPVVLKDFPQTPTPTAAPTISTVTVGPNGSLVFSPDVATIHVGDTIHWVWGSGPHTVSSGTAPTADNQFCSPDNLDCPGGHFSFVSATFDHQFLTQGTYQYFCEVHGAPMTGTIVVLP